MRTTRCQKSKTAPEQLLIPSDPAIWLEVIRRLIELGWLIRGGKKTDPDPKGRLPPQVKQALRRYQQWAGLEADGVPGPVTLHHLREPRLWCGTPDALGAEQSCKWPQRDVTWNLAASLPGVSDGDFKAAIEWAAGQWNAACGIRLAYQANARTVNVLLIVANLGGPGGVLADQELPCGARPNTRLRGHYDQSELWHAGGLPVPNGFIPLRLTALHELGHALGLPHHAPGSTPAVMDPSLNTALTGLQDWDAAEAQVRYGKPANPGPGAAGPWQIIEQNESVLKLQRQPPGISSRRAA